MKISPDLRIEAPPSRLPALRPAAPAPAFEPSQQADQVRLGAPLTPPLAMEPEPQGPLPSDPGLAPLRPAPVASTNLGTGLDVPSAMVLLEPEVETGLPPSPDLAPADAQAIGAVRQGLEQHPILARVVEAFILDKDHPMNLVAYLKDVQSRPVVLEHLDRMASLCPVGPSGLGNLVEQTFNPEVPLLTDSGAELGNRDGVAGPQRLRQQLIDRDPELFAMGQPESEEEWGRLKAHASVLRTEVLPGLTGELEALVADLPTSGGFPAVNARAKSAAGMADKIGRMQKGNDGKAPRPDYCLADMPDAVGGRITVRDPRQLQQVMDRLEERFGKENLFEKDNFYANPKKRLRPYRCITYTVVHQGVPCEVQLTTLNASLAADLWHNTGYKPLHPDLGEDEIGYLGDLQCSVSADEHRILGTGAN